MLQILRSQSPAQLHGERMLQFVPARDQRRGLCRADLPHELAERFAEQFRQPEMFMRVDGKIVAAPRPDEQVQGGMSY